MRGCITGSRAFFALTLCAALAACGPRSGESDTVDGADTDADGDGYTRGEGDCADDDSAVNPGASEDCGDGVDNNCDDAADADDYACMSACDRAAADRSSVGCIYYAVDTNPMHSWIAGDFAVAVSNVAADVPVNVTVELKEAGTWAPVAGGSFVVQPLELVTLPLPHRYIDGSAIYDGGAYRITSDQPVIAYQFNPLDGSSSALSDASLLLPVSALDRYYIVPAWPYGPADSSDASGHPAHVQIAAAGPTDVTVTATTATLAGASVPGLVPGTPQTIHLEEGDYLQVTVQSFGQSLSGTYVEASAPVAVFTSNDCANVPAMGSQACCCEHLEEQVFGLQTWGTKYVAAQVPVRNGEAAIWQIMAQEDGTEIDFSAAVGVTGLPEGLTLGARQQIQLEVRGDAVIPGDFLIEASKPIHVTQYMVGANYAQSSSMGDPSMVQAIPTDQFLDQYVILVPNTWEEDYLVLVRDTGRTVWIDGTEPSTTWSAVGEGKEATRVLVPDGVHVVNGEAPFGAIVVGYDAYDSYAYPGGLGQVLINPID